MRSNNRILQDTTKFVKVDEKIFEMYQQEVINSQFNGTVGEIYQKWHGYDKANWSLNTVGENRAYLLYMTLCNLLNN
jgi:hypothetical protein